MCIGFPLIVAGWLALAQQGEASSRTPEAQKPPGAAMKALEGFKADASAYSIRLVGRPDDKLALRDEPLLHWGNPARYGEDGAVFVWTLEGRPEVVDSVFTFRQGDRIHRKHEYHSLAAGPLSADYRGQRVWAPKLAGIAFQTVSGAAAPAATPRMRLSQMKTLAREFSARMVEFNGQRSELRLLPQPLLRYESQDQSISDGALFSFSLGTDPEALLLLEVRTDHDDAVWQFAFARFHFMDLTGFHQGHEVWHVDSIRGMPGISIGSPKYQDSVYATYQVSVFRASE